MKQIKLYLGDNMENLKKLTTYQKNFKIYLKILFYLNIQKRNRKTITIQ